MSSRRPAPDPGGGWPSRDSCSCLEGSTPELVDEHLACQRGTPPTRRPACPTGRARASAARAKRSRYGCSATRRSSSGTRSVARPSSRSASILRSSAASRSSSSRSRSAGTNGAPSRPASAAPRQSASAACSFGAASAGCSPRALSTRDSKRSRSSSSRPTASRYPVPCVRTRSRPRIFRRPCTATCSAFAAVAGGLLAPERVDHAVARDDLVRAQEQQREHRTLLPAAERERLSLGRHLERPENPELESRIHAAYDCSGCCPSERQANRKCRLRSSATSTHERRSQ